MLKFMLGTHPFLLGFDQLERLVERTAKTGNEGYPPYNIQRANPNPYRITLAVACSGEDDLSITIEDSQLVVKGRHNVEKLERGFLHRGIASLQFQRTFVLADGVEVGSTIMENKLLKVALNRASPETIIKTIEITKRTTI